MRTARSLIVSRRISRMPPFAMHAPPLPHKAPLHHTFPFPGNHACPLATTHTPQQPHTLPWQPGMPPGNHAHPPVDRITDACENITLPQLSCGR